MKESFAVLAMILNIIAYLVYFNQVKKKKSTPNLTTWGLWTFITVVDFLSYENLSGDLLISLNFFIDSVACGAIVVYVILYQKNKKFRPTLAELSILILSITALYIWWCLKNVEAASIVICIASTLASIPTLSDVWEDPKKEEPLSWWYSTASYLMMTLSVVIGRKEPVEYVAPLVLLLVHAGVAILSSENRKQKNIFKK